MSSNGGQNRAGDWTDRKGKSLKAERNENKVSIGLFS